MADSRKGTIHDYRYSKGWRCFEFHHSMGCKLGGTSPTHSGFRKVCPLMHTCAIANLAFLSIHLYSKHMQLQCTYAHTRTHIQKRNKRDRPPPSPPVRIPALPVHHPVYFIDTD